MGCVEAVNLHRLTWPSSPSWMVHTPPRRHRHRLRSLCRQKLPRGPRWTELHHHPPTLHPPLSCLGGNTAAGWGSRSDKHDHATPTTATAMRSVVSFLWERETQRPLFHVRWVSLGVSQRTLSGLPRLRRASTGIDSPGVPQRAPIWLPGMRKYSF